MRVVNLVKVPMSMYFDMPNSNLRHYLDRNVSGNPVVIRTTFAKGRSPEEVLDEWDDIVRPHLLKWPTLSDYETEMRAKVGPLSYQKPLSERMQDIESYFKLGDNSQAAPVSDEAIKVLLDRWSGMRGIRMRSRTATLERMKSSTNSGPPYFTKRSWVENRLLPFTINRISELEYLLKLPEWEGHLSAVLGWRGQEGGPNAEDTKQRVLWMFSQAANLAELQVYQPLIEGCQQFSYVPSWQGNPAVDDAVTALFDTKKEHDLIMCTDFSKFDQHFNQSMQTCALQILRGMFTESKDFSDWLENIFPLKYALPLIVSNGVACVGLHGMASGSGGTNADETLAHHALQIEAALSVGKSLNIHSMCLGDDGVLSYPGLRVDHVMSTYVAHGQEMNAGKQYVSPYDLTYLRRWHHTRYRVGGRCVGVYPTMRALGHLLYQERWIDPDKWGPKAIAMRQLSIINNCEYHPAGEEFVEYCMKRDKYRLGLDIPGFMKGIDKIYREAKANETLYVSYASEFGDPKPPSQWWVTKVLRKIA